MAPAVAGSEGPFDQIPKRVTAMDDPPQLSTSSTALVPAEAESPTKRLRHELVPETLSPTQLVSLIQSTITDSLQASLGPLETAVRTMSRETASQGARLDAVEARISENQVSLQEMDEKHTKRMDELQDQMIELQKTASGSPMRGPGTSPASSHTTPPPGYRQNRNEPSFKIILGGWKSGERREYLETQLAKVLEVAGLKEKVAMLSLSGKRPRSARLELKDHSCGDLAARRTQQQAAIKAIRDQAWTPRDCSSPMWATGDKSPSQRVIGRAIARLSQFAETCLGRPRGSVEVDSWPAGRSFMDDYQVSGAFPNVGFQESPPTGVTIRWIAQDGDAGVSVWVNLDAVAKALSLDVIAVAAQWDSHFRE